MFLFVIISLLSLVTQSSQQKDPLTNFCRIHSHQTAIVDRKLIIDGGIVNWAPISANPLNYTSTWLKSGDLDVKKQGFPRQSILAKNDSVPSVHGGILWPDTANKLVYQYGGDYGDGKPTDFKLWYYDIVYDTWNISDASTTDTRRASWGAGATAQDRAQGFYYGGYLTNASVPGYNTETALSNMLVYNMLDGSFRNQSGPDDIPRAEGVMVYLPVGDAGMLAYFGGIEIRNDTKVGVPMKEIRLYDIGNNRWYQETASGDVPEDRRRFCAGATWADDRSSYNIYLYGGASIGEGVGFGDVYVLSLPSFKWIKFWPRPEDNEGSTLPHHSLTCDVIGNSQMIIMGGTFPNTTDCDVPVIQGQHGLDLGKQNGDGAKWASYDPSLTTYKVPQEIAQTVGGGPTGGATALAPTSGWQQRDLSIQFGRAYTPGTRDPTRDFPSATSTPTSVPSLEPVKSSNKGAIIGGAVGGAIGGLIVIAAITACLLWYKKRRNSQPTRRGSELQAQSISYPKSPAISDHQNFYYPPEASPPPPLRTWGDFPHHFSPDNKTHYAAPHPQLSPNHTSPTAPSYYSPISPPEPGPTMHELPIVRSPMPIHTLRPIEAPANSIDPYFAQHPPSPPRDAKFQESID
ncbi:hypothetical protein CC78DRAFT_548631 [Lojkania enalia]|uniref:Cell wall anchored protein n=1 Tax=Lojkania enalia TaxID=147567 RepID=A0A9P4JYT6_9PLEO|nr:hypothetical protein CC78DRAFT_548631 [Didymosphaeria enalia]